MKYPFNKCIEYKCILTPCNVIYGDCNDGWVLSTYIQSHIFPKSDFQWQRNIQRHKASCGLSVIAEILVTECKSVTELQHYYTSVSECILTPCNVACGSGIVTVNSPSATEFAQHIGIWFPFPHITSSSTSSPPHPLLHSSLSSSRLSSSITPSLFHSRLKTYLFNKSFPP